MVKAEVVEFTSRSGLVLHGLLFFAGNGLPTVIHVHGACGNFLSFKPVIHEASYLVSQGVNLLSINTSGHDCIAEGYQRNQYVYVGGALREFGECVDDISGAVDFASSISDRIILQGHSLGCDRVVHYQLATQDWRETVLLSPCDSYQLQRVFRKPESVEAQLLRLGTMSSSHEFELLAPEEYGVIAAGEDYRIPVTLRSFLSIANGPPFTLFRLDRPARYLVQSRCLVCVGGKDPLQTAPPARVFEHLSGRFSDVDCMLLPEGDHEMEPCSDQMFVQVKEWIRAIRPQNP